jgi:hypothetical protein
MKFFSLIFLFILLLSCAFAGETDHKLRVQSKDGKFHKIKASTYLNSWGRPEVRLEATAIPNIVKGINPILGFGRDLDDDGKIESWFMYNTREGFKVHQFKTNHPFGFDAVQNQLFKEYSTSADMYLNVTTVVLASYMSMAASHVYSSQIEFAQELFDLHEIAVRLHRGQSMERKTLNQKQVRLISMLLQEGLRRSQEKLQKAEGKEFFVLAAVDVGIFLSSAKIIALLGKGARFIGTALLNTAEGQFFAGLIRNFISHKMIFIKNIGAKLGTLASLSTVALQNAIFKTASHQALKRALANVVRAMIAKNRVYTLVETSARKAAQMAYRWNPAWKMTLLKKGTGVVMSLAMPHRDVDPSSFMHDLMAQEETRINILASVDVSPNTQFSAQVIGMADLKNKTVTYFGQQKTKEKIVKASWKVGPLSYLDMADNHAMEFLEQATVHSNKGHLQLIGYMIVVVNEVGWNHVKDKVEDKLINGQPAGQKTILVPITVETPS